VLEERGGRWGHSERYSDLILTGQSRPTRVLLLLFSALFSVAQRCAAQSIAQTRARRLALASSLLSADIRQLDAVRRVPGCEMIST